MSNSEAMCWLLLYLDKKKILDEMKEYCQKFLEKLFKLQRFPPLRFLLKLDVLDVLDLIPNVGCLLLREPSKFEQFCNNILYSCLLATNADSDKFITYSQCAVNLRLSNVPIEFVTLNFRGYYSGLFTYKGIILNISKTSPYVYHSVWSCSEECEGSDVILRSIPKNRPNCDVCRGTLFENSGLRGCGDQVTITFKLQNEIFSKEFIVKDDIIECLKLGSKYVISGYVLKENITILGIDEQVTLHTPLSMSSPKDINKLFITCKRKPWTFVYCLASSIGNNLAPLNCFMHLKINLLLSLASVKANAVNNSTILHVLTASSDTCYVEQIMQQAAGLADSFYCLGASNTDISTALIASSGGVCIMSLPLHCYKQKNLSAILTTLETGEISSEVIKMKLNSGVWAHGSDTKNLNMQNLARVFGTVCQSDVSLYTEELIEHALQKSVNPVKATLEEKNSLKDIKLLLDLVAGLKVDLDSATENILRMYILAVRKERPKGLSMANMGALVSICLTSARLCRRSTTNNEDAVFAIWLHISGSAEPRFAPEEYLETPADIKKLQKNILAFKDWLEQFIGGLINI